MREANTHLALDEIFVLLRPEGQEVDVHTNQELTGHLSRCADCAEAIERYKGVMTGLNPFKGGDGTKANQECPQPDIWVQVAAGVLSDEDSLRYLEHAALCSACSGQLKEALEIVGPNTPPPAPIQEELKTGTPARQKKLASEMARRSRQFLDSPAQPAVPFVKKSSWTFPFPVWAYGALAAVLLLGVALAIFLQQGLGPTDRLLGQAYAQHRTVELRIPEAGYGPVRVERAPNQSHLSSPGALLEAEAAIKKGLEQHPDDPDLLRQKAEADLLNRDFQPAIETLGHALRIQPQSAKLLVDLATAHFERAEATDTPADYESALQYLGNALRLSPKDPAALFNRAIVHERLFLYSRAIADWEQFLTVEPDTGWKQEAQKRLDEIRSRQHRHSARDAPDHLTVAEFKKAVENKTTLDPEQYLELAERKIFPNITQANQQDPNYQLGTLLAVYFESSQSDRFLADLMQSAGQPAFHKAAQLLAETSTKNSVARYEDAYLRASHAEKAFRQLGGPAGALAAKFEQIYALQLEAQANPCTAMASELAGAARQKRYTWLEIQALLEQAICSNMQGNLSSAKELAQQASRLAKASNYQGFYLRSLVVLATLESEAGDESTAWAAVREGLERYWSGNLPAMRGYSFYTLLRLMAEHLGHWNVQFAAADEALGFLAENPNHLVQAAERSRLADAALHLGETKVAEEQFAKAAQLFSEAPQTSSVRWRELEARIGLARAQFLESNGVKDTVSSLLSYLPEVQQLSNRYVESEYYNTIAELKTRQGDWQTARKFLETAVHLADNGLSSLSTWQERFTWSAQQRQTYILMAKSLLREGNQAGALQVWEDFLAAKPGTQPNHNSQDKTQDPPRNVALEQRSSEQATILTYALFPDSLTIWVHDRQQVHSVSVPVHSIDLKRTAENFAAECSRPNSSLPLLRSDAQTLYSWLIGPAGPWLQASGHLIVEPDGALNGLPFEALITTSGKFLGTQYTVTMAPGLIAHDRILKPMIVPSDHALIVAAPTQPDGSLGPPPGALTEAREVVQQFSQSTILSGGKAISASVEREIFKSNIFHFAGHATYGRSGSAMLLADGNLSVAATRPGHPGVNSRSLNGLKLAVFSACGTAKPSEAAQSNGLVAEFLHAGAPTVVASRWNVDSLATTEFMGRFYRSLLFGQAVADALQIAAGEFRKRPDWSHPYYWAAFSSFGNG